MPAWLPVLGIGLTIAAIVFFVWKMQREARETQKEADNQKARGDTNESALNGLMDAKAAEREAGIAEYEARKNAKNSPPDQFL